MDSKGERTDDTRSNARGESVGNALGAVLLPLGLIFGLVLLLSLNVGAPGAEAAENPLETWLKIIVGYIATGAEIAASLVIGFGVLRAVVFSAGYFVTPKNQPPDSTEAIRLRLGRVLALGLEFTVASDILRTAVAPTRQDILNLGALVLLRTLLNYFLEREIREGERAREASRT